MLLNDEAPPKGRILVVDDQPNLCWVLSKLLSERGHTVRTAHSGSAAFLALPDFDCQVVVADYRLPDTNGIDLLRQLSHRLPKIRCLLMTSYGNATLLDQVIEEALFAYFDKPFNNALMIRTIENAIRDWHSGGDSRGAGERARTQFPGRAIATP